MEHRQAQREAVDMFVLLNASDKVARYGRMTNLSKSGAEIILQGGAVERHSILEVKLLPLRHAPQSQKNYARGYVVWVEGNRCGLLWVEDEVVMPLIPNFASVQSTPLRLMLTARQQGK